MNIPRRPGRHGRPWHALHRLDDTLWLLGTDGLAAEPSARALQESAAARTRLVTAQRGPWGFYGYEAAALTLAATATRRSAAIRWTRPG